MPERSSLASKAIGGSKRAGDGAIGRRNARKRDLAYELLSYRRGEVGSPAHRQMERVGPANNVVAIKDFDIGSGGIRAP
jgi:hypothetical protein